MLESCRILVGSSDRECCSDAVSGVLVVSDVGETALSVVPVMWEGVPSDSEGDLFCGTVVRFFLPKAQLRLCGKSGRHELRRNASKAPPCPERGLSTPLPQQSSSSTMEEGGLWSAQETMAIARMEQYVNNSDCIKIGYR